MFVEHIKVLGGQHVAHGPDLAQWLLRYKLSIAPIYWYNNLFSLFESSTLLKFPCFTCLVFFQTIKHKKFSSIFFNWVACLSSISVFLNRRDLEAFSPGLGGLLTGTWTIFETLKINKFDINMLSIIHLS